MKALDHKLRKFAENASRGLDGADCLGTVLLIPHRTIFLRVVQFGHCRPGHTFTMCSDP